MTSVCAPDTRRPHDSTSVGPNHLWWLFTGIVAAGLLVALAVLAGLGELTSMAAGLLDPGPLVRVGLPVARTVHDLTASLTVGLLVLAVWVVAPEPGSRPDSATGPRLQLLRAASVSAGAWLVSAAAVTLLTVADVAGLPLNAPGFTRTAVTFVTRMDLGRALGASLLLVLAVAVLSALACTVTRAGW